MHGEVKKTGMILFGFPHFARNNTVKIWITL